MRKKLVLLLTLVLLFVAYVVFRYFILNQQSVYGRLKVLSSPTASIFLNNLAVGKTPFEDKVKEGEYMLKLIPEGIATDTASWQGKINIYKNSLTYVDRELGSSDLTSAGAIFTTTKMTTKPRQSDYGEIELETEPAGSIVYLDNDEKGIAPLLLADVVMGDHELSVFTPGFFRRTQKINVDSGYRVIAKFKLAIDQSQTQLIQGKKKGEEEDKEATESAGIQKTYVIVNDTPTGWLRVREGPFISASESAKVKPKDKFELLEEKNGWYKINYEKDKEGWISSQYAEKKEE
jgi:uncharacterized protein YgiM (DUF1202 family)